MESILKDTRKPDITFSVPDGAVTISSYLSNILCIHDGDVIDILTDNGEVYIAVKFRQPLGKHEATCRKANKCGSCMRCYSKKLTQALADLCKVDADRFSLYVGEEREQLGFGTIVPLITKNVIL